MSDQSVIPTSLPPQFYGFFWDIDASKLDPSEKPFYVINRLLDKGDLEAARWILKIFPKDLVIQTIKTRRDFSFKTVNFWAQYFDIPKGDIKCMQEPYRTLRKLHWLN